MDYAHSSKFRRSINGPGDARGALLALLFRPNGWRDVTFAEEVVRGNTDSLGELYMVSP